jgi:hypothetical protein
MNGSAGKHTPVGDSDCWDPEVAANAPNAGIEIFNTVICDLRYLTMDELLFIHDNLIHENTGAGITLHDEAAMAGNRILWNDIVNNGLYGVWSDATTVVRDEGDFYEPTDMAEVDVIFRYNDVTGNGWGVYNAAWVNEVGPSLYFNAKENFWNACETGGDDGPLADCPPGGPSRGPAPCAHLEDRRYWPEDFRPLGMGDAVDKGTFYNPWLTVEAFEFSEDFCCMNNVKTFLNNLDYQHKRIYGSDSLILQAGWNTLAVPLPLRTDYQTLEDLRTLGDFLEMDDGMGGRTKKYEIAYEYENTGAGWSNLDPGDLILPVHGYLIKMIEPTRFPVLYSGASVYPMYDLTDSEPGTGMTGWNFIGSAFGIDRTDNGKSAEQDDQGRWAVADPDNSFENSSYEPEAYMWASDYLRGLIDCTGNKGLTTLFNPWVTGQIEKDWLSWQPDVCGATKTNDEKMWAGQSYWAYMADDRALRGIEYAPLYFADDPPLPWR